MHPMDLIPENSTIELKPVKQFSIFDLKDSNYTILKPDGFIEVGKFNENGLATGEVDSNLLGSIKNLKIIFHINIENWIVINDIGFE